MKKENIPLVLGLAIPVLLVIVLGLVIYLPRLFVEPEYDFVYVVGDYPIYVNAATNEQVEYVILNGRLSKKVSSYDEDRKAYRTNDAEFYRYDVEAEKSLPLSDAEVMGLTLDTGKKSPDGFELNYGSDVDNVFEGIFGGGRDYSERVLEKGSVAIPVDIVSANDRYSYNWQFVGWVK